MKSALKRYSVWIKLPVMLLSAFLLAQAFWVFMLALGHSDRSNGRYTRYLVHDAIISEAYTDTSAFKAQYESVLSDLDSVARLVGWLGDIEKGITDPPDKSGYPPSAYYGEDWTRGMIERDLSEVVGALNARNGVVYYCAVAELGVVYSNPTGVPVDWVMNFEYSYDRDRSRAMAYTDEYIAGINSDFEVFRAVIFRCVGQIAALLMGYVVCSAYLVMAAGRKTTEERIYLNAIDRLYTEITLTLVLLAPVGALGAAMTFYPSAEMGGSLHAVVVSVCTVIFAVSGVFAMSVVRRAKDKTLLTHTLVFTLCRAAFRFFRRAYSERPPERRVSAVIVGLGILTMLPPLGIFTIPASVYLAARALKRLTDAQGRILNEEMEKRLRAEQLRTELISNVSHDIRTPLTSVITYIDLLKKEGSHSEKAREYIGIIESKAHRLQELTDDLFEASKAASGNIPVTIERVDLNALVTQGLGEMDAKIRDSGLDFRVSLSKEPVVVSADGRLLWRVVENQLSNVFKYAMPGSRVYVETSDGGDIATLAVKNISAMPLNLSADELLERFKRGDESRSNEGSGLGLTIAKSLSEAMGGQFYIAIDGDLFKATVSLPKAPEHGLDGDRSPLRRI
ncbi:MAG: HAMP domain-containing histidine kinase [Oscillospiraceae bacterium]|jgi:signal transduction histidine kinase|nr:HAMP domain-containing histidine kinase [Oscillospiraceae bacterium]